MKINKFMILKIGIALVVLVLVIISIKSLIKKENNNVESANYTLTEESNKTNELKDSVENKEEKVINSENNSKNEATLHTSDNTIKNNVQNESEIKEQYKDNDKTVIATFDNIENDVDNLLKEEKTETVKDKLKGTFITIVDFIFYNKPINGVYFKDLTASAKLKVIGIALKVDGIIEKYYPQYKEGLSESYKNAKSKLIELYLEYTTKYCDNNDEVCDQAKEDFQSLKKSLNITWDIIKELTNSGVSKLKRWYEIYSGK